jgi:DoxX-like family
LALFAIVTDRFPRLKEWAYAGFAFDFLGATASHLFAGDSGHAPFPLIFFFLLMGSYFFWHRQRNQGSPSNQFDKVTR